MTPLDGSTEVPPQAGRHPEGALENAAYCPTAERLRGAPGALRPGSAAFLRDALVGLSGRPKSLSPKYFYDETGSRLFDEICELPEYYVTRTELAILERSLHRIADRLTAGGRPVRVIEPGAGSGTKTRLLLRALGAQRCQGYVPVDIDGVHLANAAERLGRELPWLAIEPCAADFTVDLPVPPLARSERERTRDVVYFPGSTIGNFDPREATCLLARFAAAAGPDGAVLVGVDLKKDPALLHAAYNDASGVTAAFNKNVLRRMNDELGASFDLDRFHHYALYAPGPGRIEMHLVSAGEQVVELGGERIAFADGESICTEHSYKYDVASAERLARTVGLSLVDHWLDDDRRFAVLLFYAHARARAERSS
jgi:dimethylhistidine N-methyltransferase